jgi:site-specific DNA recombinase
VSRRCSPRAPKVISPNILRSDYLLSGLLFCARCGQLFIGHAAKSGQNHYYGCQSKLKKGAITCASKLLPQEQAERAVIGGLRTHVLTAEYLKDLVERVNTELAAGSDAVRTELTALEAQHAEARRKLDRLYEALESGALELEDLAPRIRETKAREGSLTTQLETAREQLRGQVIHLADEATIARYLDSLHALLALGSASQKRAFLRSFIRRIEADERTLTVHFELPPLPGQDPEPFQLSEAGDSTEVLSGGKSGDPKETRTPVCAVRGRCPNR